MGYDRRVKQLFEDYDKDNDGILTLADFFNYNLKNLIDKQEFFYKEHYKEQFISDLEKLRYHKNLILYNEPLDISFHYHIMMRCKLYQSP